MLRACAARARRLGAGLCESRCTRQARVLAGDRASSSALVRCLLQQVFGVVARSLCIGHRGGERLRSRVGEDLVGVGRGSLADEPDVSVRKILGRSALAEDQ